MSKCVYLIQDSQDEKIGVYASIEEAEKALSNYLQTILNDVGTGYVTEDILSEVSVSKVVLNAPVAYVEPTPTKAYTTSVVVKLIIGS